MSSMPTLTVQQDAEQKADSLLKLAAEKSLYQFVKQAWPFVESVPFVDNWHLGALAEHLGAVTSGQIKSLLVNVPPGCAKPAWVEEWVLEKARGRIRLASVCVGDKILTHRGRFRSVTAIHEQGVLPLVRVETHTGRSVCTAEDHPFLTPRGWIQAKDLHDGDVLACVHATEPSGTATVTPEEARLLGYLIGDGCCKYHTVTFTNADKAVLSDFEHCATAVGFRTKTRPRPEYRTWESLVVLPVCLNGKTKWHTSTCGPHPVWSWLSRHLLKGACSYDKRVPPAIMSASNGLIAQFVGAYWSCDGYIAKRGDSRTDCVIGADTVCEGLARDIQHLLSRLGILARVRRKQSKIHSKRQGDLYVSWQVTCSTLDHGSRFADVIPLAHSVRSKLLKRYTRSGFDRILNEDQFTGIYPAGNGRCRCLTVEEDSSFVVNDIAVHNSLLTSVFWPMWEWANDPAIRWFFASYDQRLSTRDSVKCRALINSSWYQANWGNKFQLKDDANLKTLYETTAGGYRLATSVGGHGTGEHPDRIVCLPWSANIITDSGCKTIGEIVQQRLPVKVLGFNHFAGVAEWQSIKQYQSTVGKPLITVTTHSRSIDLTADHEVYVVGSSVSGCIPANQLRKHDSVIIATDGRVEFPGSPICVNTDYVVSVSQPFIQPSWVFNLQTSGHNYFANGVLVHNCDDPNNVQGAESPAERQAVDDWWNLTMPTRGVARDVRKVVIQQRLHGGDLSGIILEQGEFDCVIILPMRYEPNRMVDTPLGWNDPRTQDGELLWPALFTEAKVAALEKQLGYAAAGQLQQRPTPREGAIFKEEWFQYYTPAAGYFCFKSPIDRTRIIKNVSSSTCRYFITVDLATSLKKLADYTVVCVWADDTQGNLILVELFRDRIEGPKIIPKVKALYHQYHAMYACIESVGYQLRDVQQAKIDGLAVREMHRPAGHDKVARAMVATTRLSAGQVWIPDCVPWLKDFKDELTTFPLGKHDDIVDNVSDACEQMAVIYKMGGALVKPPQAIYGGPKIGNPGDIMGPGTGRYGGNY